MNKREVLTLNRLERRFKSGGGQLLVLDKVDLNVGPGEMVGLVGPSGSGKSSLLHAAGLLEAPNGGEVKIGAVSGWELDDGERTAMRRENIGFVYQFHHLLPEFTALENAALPALIAGKSKEEADAEAKRLLLVLGLGDRLEHRPSQLSGGEQQRVAIARALVNKPLLVLADEPTGNLDPDTSNAVFNALADLVKSEGASAIIATHNYELVRFMDRVIGLVQGRLVELDPGLPIEAQLTRARRDMSLLLPPEAKVQLFPWARFWAKQVDLLIHTMVFTFVVSWASTVLGFDTRSWVATGVGLLCVVAGCMLTYPVTDALFVSATGGSPGRAFFRFSVRLRNGKRASFKKAFSRAWTCLFFGQSLGVLTYWASYTNLLEHGASLWDRDAGTEVVHRGPRWWSWIAPLIWAGVLGLDFWGAWAVFRGNVP